MLSHIKRPIFYDSNQLKLSSRVLSNLITDFIYWLSQQRAIWQINCHIYCYWIIRTPTDCGVYKNFTSFIQTHLSAINYVQFIINRWPIWLFVMKSHKCYHGEIYCYFEILFTDNFIFSINCLFSEFLVHCLVL